jgi:LTXXQ motif family protein
MRRISLASAVVLTLACGAAGTLPAAAQRDRGLPSASQVADQIDARIAKLKADLRLNDDQGKNWGGVQSALHDIGVNRANRYLQRDQAAADTQRDANAPPRDANAPPPPRDANAAPPADARERNRTPDVAEFMRREADYLSNRASDLRKLADATGPFYSSLDDKQKRRFLDYLRSERDEDRGMMRDRWR